MKRLFIMLGLLSITCTWQPAVVASPIACIACGSVTLSTPGGVDGTVSFAVVSGADFNAEVAAHGFMFDGLVPPGNFWPPVRPAPTDFVYLYQLVNSGVGGVNVDSIRQWTIEGSSFHFEIAPGPRLESTLFVDPNLASPALITAGSVVAPVAPGLSAGPMVDFENGLSDPFVGPTPIWGSCAGSETTGISCSDAQVDLQIPLCPVCGWQLDIGNWAEAQAGGLLPPFWSSSVIWYSSKNSPGAGRTSITGTNGSAVGTVPVARIPDPGVLALMLTGCIGLAIARRRSKTRACVPMPASTRRA